MHRIVSLDLPCKDDVLLFGGNLEGVVMPFPPKQAGQNLDEAAVGPHEVVVDETSAVHAHLQPHPTAHYRILRVMFLRMWPPNMHKPPICYREQ